MSGKTTDELPTGLARVREQFDRWRRMRPVGARILEALWDAAVKIAGKYGVARTSSALRLDYYALKKRLNEASALVPDFADGSSGPQFVELAATPWSGPIECTVELEHPGGAKMRVHLKGNTVPDLAALSRCFWSVDS